MATDLQTALYALTAHPSTDQPFLTVYLDWVPDGNGRRPSVMILERELDQSAARLAGDSPRRKSFEADRRRIMNYANSEAPKEARGLAIFACDAEGIWYALPL